MLYVVRIVKVVEKEAEMLSNLCMYVMFKCRVQNNSRRQRTSSRQNHNLSWHIYICMEKLSGWKFNLANQKATGTVDLEPIIQ